MDPGLDKLAAEGRIYCLKKGTMSNPGQVVGISVDQNGVYGVLYSDGVCTTRASTGAAATPSAACPATFSRTAPSGS